MGVGCGVSSDCRFSRRSLRDDWPIRIPNRSTLEQHDDDDDYDGNDDDAGSEFPYRSFLSLLQ